MILNYGEKPSRDTIKNINLDLMPEKFKKWYIYWRGFYDIDFFIEFFLAHYQTDKKTGVKIADAPFHKELRGELKSQQDLVVIVPRDHAKTTNSFFDDVHDICYQNEKLIFLIMSEGLGVETIGKIRDEFETNERINWIFGRLVPNKSKEEANKKWTRKTLDFLNGVSIESVTMGGTIRGKRPTKIKVDDPQEDKDVRNQEITNQFNNWFWSTVYSTLDPNGRCIVLGTVIGPLCLVVHISEGDRGFRVIKYEAVKDIVFSKDENGKEHITGGEPLWKAKWTLEALDKRFQTLKKGPFMQEYQNVPNIVLGDLVFDLDKPIILKEYEVDTLYKDLWLYKPGRIEHTNGSYLYVSGLIAGVDTAKGGESGDYSSISVRDREGKLYAFYYGRIKPDQLCGVIDRLFDLGYLPLVAIENNNTGLATIQKAREYIWDRYLYVMRRPDKISNSPTEEYGWNTNAKTRPLAIAEYEKAIRDGDIVEVDSRLYNEYRTFAYDENRKPVAIKPYHDDGVMADSIGWQMRKEPIIS